MALCLSPLSGHGRRAFFSALVNAALAWRTRNNRVLNGPNPAAMRATSQAARASGPTFKTGPDFLTNGANHAKAATGRCTTRRLLVLAMLASSFTLPSSM